MRSVADAVLATGRPERTIRAWANRSLIKTACDIRTRRVMVDLVDAYRMSEKTDRRNRGPQGDEAMTGR